MVGREVAVTFDLWETLFLHAGPENEVRLREMRCEGLCGVLRKFGLTAEVSELYAGYGDCDVFRAAWAENREVSTSEQIRAVLRSAMGEKWEPREPELVEALRDAYVNPIFEAPPVLNEAAAEVLSKLRVHTDWIGMISNTGRTPGTALFSLIEQFGLAEYFDAFVFSDEVGWRKPDKRIFEVAAKKLRVSPERITHIGDSLVHDVWGAKRAGMRTVRLDNSLPAEFTDVAGSVVRIAMETAGGAPSGQVKPDHVIESLAAILDFI